MKYKPAPRQQQRKSEPHAKVNPDLFVAYFNQVRVSAVC